MAYYVREVNWLEYIDVKQFEGFTQALGSVYFENDIQFINTESNDRSKFQSSNLESARPLDRSTR